MNRHRLRAFLVILFLLPGAARAHVGSPDVFYDGMAGPYPTRVTIRMPPVVPGRAEIDVRPQAKGPIEVSFLPLYSRTSVKNAPPPEPARLVPGEPGLYCGDLWLMSVGAYSIEVRVRGEAGEGVVQIPVNSVATHQLPLPPLLGGSLLALGALLVIGGLGIVRAATAESVLPPGVPLQSAHRRKGLIASAIAALVFILLLSGGWHWWMAEEREFRRHLREGAWPDLSADVRMQDSQRLLHLTLGEKAFAPDYTVPLLPDHGKLLHLFLIREPARDVFAHLHPVRDAGKTFTVALPPLPEGDYRIFVDLTLADSGVSATAGGSVHIPPPLPGAPFAGGLRSDPDDSWSADSQISIPPASAAAVCILAGGLEVVWKVHPPLRARHDACLDFEVRDSSGRPVPLEPYMGMMSHAAILRSDDAVFAHLHPSGNFSMSAQSYFAAKLAKEAGSTASSMPPEMDHSKMGDAVPPNPAASSISLPFEFPSAGAYRIWVQFKTAGQILTAVFDTVIGAGIGGEATNGIRLTGIDAKMMTREAIRNNS